MHSPMPSLKPATYCVDAFSTAHDTEAYRVEFP